MLPSDILLEDPKVPFAWYFNETARSPLTLNIESVWQDYRGTGVTVGVLDSQIEFTHRDLSTAYDTSLDYNFDQNTGKISDANLTDTHGTMVAGVIAAEGGNGTGSTGIAPGVTLVGLGINYGGEDVIGQVVDGLRAGAELDVINSSWSFTQNFFDDFSDPDNSAMADAVRFVAETGRDGLGTTMVFSAGNSGTGGSSNYHNFQNSPYAIAVGGVENDGSTYDASSLGANVLISAPGTGVRTTTLDDGYTAATGTSFAAPVVSAVVALMLEANPELGYRDIQQILAMTATREGLGDYSDESEGWQTNGAGNVNGGGMHYSDAFGYGFVDPHAAVRLAETWTEQQTAANRDSVTVNQDSGARLVAGEVDEISVDIEIDARMEVEHVQISLDMYHPQVGNLEVFLVSPEGTSVQLVYDRGQASNGNPTGFAFTSVGSMGEMAAGTWTLQIINTDPEAARSSGTPISGTLNDVTLTVFGDGDDFEDDTYVYTDEFSTLTGGDADRRVLRDTDGGTDTINAAAVTSDSRIDLSGAGGSRIDGVSIDIDRADRIENIFTGDGNDELTGNAADNIFASGRGNDLIHYSAGNDTLDGGAGRDTLDLGTTFASITGFFTNAGTFMLGVLDMGLSAVSSIEEFRFTDVTYSFGEIEGILSDGVRPPADPVEPPAEPETPAEPVDPPSEPDAPVEPVDPPSDPIVSIDPVDPPAEVPDYDTTQTGTNGDDRLRGSAEDEALYGRGGDDRLMGRDGDDMLDGGNGRDQLRGGDGVDVLIGGAGNDRLIGDAGDDTLMGGAGRDVMTGGDGADTFVFDLADVGNMDIIRDFSAAEGDRIVITGLSGTAAGDFELQERGDDTILRLNDDDGSERLLRIIGDDLSALQVSQASDDAFIFA